MKRWRGAHTLLPVTQDGTVESTARRRLRSLRVSRGWSLDELARRSYISPSTISRIENGQRRLALDQLVSLAQALETTVDDLLAGDDPEHDVIIRPTRDVVQGVTRWMLTRPGDPSGRIVAKMRLPKLRRPPESHVHPGRDWFYVLDGTAHLLLGDRHHIVQAGQAAEFDTMTPHWILGEGAPVDVLTIFDRHGERAHLST